MFQSENKAFTLIEVIAATFVIAVGAVGLLSLLQQTIFSTSISSSRLVASYLAQEGIEIVRSVRDSNWLEQRTSPEVLWDEGLPAGDWEADFETQSLSQPYASSSLNVSESGFYSYAPGQKTLFKRKISIAKDTDALEVRVEVFWQERGRTHQVAAKDHLYNWR